ASSTPWGFWMPSGQAPSTTRLGRLGHIFQPRTSLRLPNFMQQRPSRFPLVGFLICALLIAGCSQPQVAGPEPHQVDLIVRMASDDNFPNVPNVPGIENGLRQTGDYTECKSHAG